MKLLDICDFINIRTSEIYNYISTENMLPDKGGICKAESIPSGTVIEYKVGDILISNIRPYFKKYGELTVMEAVLLMCYVLEQKGM